MLAAILICGTTVFTSCSDNIDNPVPAQKKYRLVQRKEVNEDTGVYYISDYGYDDQDCLASYVRLVHKPQLGDGTYVEANVTYIYGDHYILEKHYDNFNVYYTLNDDGLIVKEQSFSIIDGLEELNDPSYYQYNDGRIISYEETKVPHMLTCHWEDGDLMSYERDHTEQATYMITFTRSELSVDHGYLNVPLSTMSEPLYMMGYYGKPSKHLESHYKSEAKSAIMNIFFDTDYTYTIADGHIVEMVDVTQSVMDYGFYQDSSTKTTTSTFTYEEY